MVTPSKPSRAGADLGHWAIKDTKKLGAVQLIKKPYTTKWRRGSSDLIHSHLTADALLSEATYYGLRDTTPIRKIIVIRTNNHFGAISEQWYQ